VARREIIKKIGFAIPGLAKDRVQPVGIALTDDGRYAFVALGPANHVAVIDQRNYEVLKYILTGRRVWQLAFTPDEKLLFTTNGISGDVTQLTPIESIKIGRYPWGVAIKSDDTGTGRRAAAGGARLVKGFSSAAQWRLNFQKHF
jgi:DNA-binding beta-propeller fold protein YncE